MDIQRVGVVGAGNMGSGIAQKIATEGLTVVLVDLNAEAAERGRQRIKDLLGEAVERKIFSAEQVTEILGRISHTDELDACASCDLVIEAIFEDLQVKRDLFATLDDICDDKTILATNTSSFYVRDVAAATQRPDRVVGLHYFYHPAKNRLVEVIPGEGTSESTRKAAWTFSEIIGKTPIHSADAPGFVVNRFFVPWLNEAVRILDEGSADIATIEAASKQAFKIGMGPFELMNVTGVPITLHASTTLGEQLGPFYAPCDLLARQVDAGDDWDLSGEPDPTRLDAVADRLMSVVFQVASQMVEDGVCTKEDADIGARVGLRWALGPFDLMNRVGVKRALGLVHSLVEQHDDLSVPQLLAEQAESGAFSFALVNLEIEDGLAEITLNRPDALNALNEDLVDQLAAAFDEADGRDDVRTIVLRGAGKAFVAGADIKFFVKNIKADNFEAIEHFTVGGQELFKRIDQSEKHVIARLDGLSLGGGSELALAADTIIATEKGAMGFPETGIGIYPGLGGTQRTTRRCGAALARYLVLTGDILNASTAHRVGLVDEVVATSAIGDRIRDLHRTGERPTASVNLDERLRAIASFFAEANLDDLLAGETNPEDAAVAKAAGRVRHKAPVACRLADEMIATGASEGIDAGLEAELSGLREVFGTADALEGLSSLGRRRPEFHGS